MWISSFMIHKIGTFMAWQLCSRAIWMGTASAAPALSKRSSNRHAWHDSIAQPPQCFSYSEWLLLQPQVGTVVKSAEDEDPVAVISVLNLQQHGSLPCLAEIRSFLLAHCQEASVKEELQQVGSREGWPCVPAGTLTSTPGAGLGSSWNGLGGERAPHQLSAPAVTSTSASPL